jgi:hypothetical protein
MASDGNIFDTPKKNKHGKSLVSTNEKKNLLDEIVDVSVYSIDCIQSIVDRCFVVFVAIVIAIVVPFIIAFVVAIVSVCSITDKEETPFS